MFYGEPAPCFVELLLTSPDTAYGLQLYFCCTSLCFEVDQSAGRIGSAQMFAYITFGESGKKKIAEV